ncbi:hypothetical protein [Microbulbifer sp. JMSA002]|uniref:hypothetical protein n=1 Tax=Microbulbifer sp. JMSA002 TaxID=3243368 RepID=UPI00403A2EFB
MVKPPVVFSVDIACIVNATQASSFLLSISREASFYHGSLLKNGLKISGYHYMVLQVKGDFHLEAFLKS